MSENLAVARAFGNEPVVVKVIAITGGTVVIARKDQGSGQAIGWPLRDIYVFEEALFRKLKQTFVRGEMATLRVIWTEAIPYPGGQSGGSKTRGARSQAQAREQV